MPEKSLTQLLFDVAGNLETGGSSNAYTLHTAQSINGYTAGLWVRAKANHTNTGASTLSINGVGDAPIRKGVTTAVAEGDIVSGRFYDFLYDADNSVFQALAVIDDAQIGSAQIANDAVTYAKLQNISASPRILGRKTAGAGDAEECTLSEVLDFIASAAQGDILYRGASSWARLGASTSGQFLQTLGAGANLAWASGFRHIGTVAASGAANATFSSIGANHGVMLLTGSNVTVTTDGARVDLRFSQSGSFLAGASDYQWNVFAGQYGGAAASTADTADNEITVALDVGNAANEYADFYLFIIRSLTSGTRHSVLGMVQWRNAAGVNIFGIAHGNLIANTNAIDGIRILPSAGNISGNFDLWAGQI